MITVAKPIVFAPQPEPMANSEFVSRWTHMEHFYESIPGYFDFPDFYREMVREFGNGAHFVEIGAWYGRSAAFMAVEIINSGKAIKFDVIDTWEGTWPRKQGAENTDPNLLQYGTMYPNFLANVRPALHAMTPIQLPSIEAVKLYPDHSLDFVFIDAGHDYDNVKQDVIAWRPKVKRGGILAGHDYSEANCPGLVRAVNECLGTVEFVHPNSWRKRV